MSAGDGQTRTFLFVGGGTGGHLYPGLAIAHHLKSLGAARGEPGGVRCVFIASDRAIDRKILEGEGAEFHASPARPMGARPRTMMRFLASWGKSVRHARGVMRTLRAESQSVHVVAMGGFVAAPCVQAARAEKLPVTLVNLDAVPGKANRWIARHAERVFTSVPIPAEHAGWLHVPPIVRPGARFVGSREEARRLLAIESGRRVLMVTGGSQGARSINGLMVALAETAGSLHGVRDSIHILHQTGAGEVERAREAYANAGIVATVQEFVKEMGLWWAAADVAVSRAGAGSVAEAWANHTPTVFMPYPFHRDEHQKHNAAALVEAGGAFVVTDLIDAAKNAAEAGRLIGELLGDGTRLAAARSSLEALGPADGAERVARALME